MPLGKPKAVDLKALRVAFFTDNGVWKTAPATAQATVAAAKRLSSAVSLVEEARPDGFERAIDLFLAIFQADAGAGVRAILKGVGTKKSHPLIHQLQKLQGDKAISVAEFGGLLVEWDEFRSAMLGFLKDYDVILCPSWGCPALRHGTYFDDGWYPCPSPTSSTSLDGRPQSSAAALRRRDCPSASRS